VLEFPTQETSEAQLADLLGELLEGEGAGGETAGRDVPAEIAEMRDVARLLRAASQSVPLPEGRLAVRRALLATLEPRGSGRFPARAAWRRTGRWLGVAAMAGMIIAAFGLGAGLLDHVGSPSNPLYVLRRAVDRVRLAFVPGRPEGGPSPFVSHAPRIPETGDIPPSGIAGPAGASGYPLGVQFSRMTIPSMPGREVTVEGKVGGLPVTLALTATTGCPAGAACGTFEAWVTPFRGTKASPEFGQMRGTFICATGECTLTPVSKTGVFNTTSAFVLQRKASGELAGVAATGFDSLGDWVATVAQVAEKLNEENQLPPGVTVKELVNDAATNKGVQKRPPQGSTGGPTTGGISDGFGVGVPTSVGVTVGTGGSGSPSVGGSVNTSTSVTGSGATVSTTGTASGSVGTTGGTASGTVSGSTTTSGTTGANSGSTSTTTDTSSGSTSTSTSTSDTTSGGTSTSAGTTTSAGTSSGSTSGSATGTVSGGTSSGSVGGSGSVSGGTSSGGGVSVGGGVSGGTSGGGTSGGGTGGGGTGGGGGGVGGGGLGGGLKL
jgi:hypothetical protein